MRHVILHYHIFKNAGSTIDSILKNNFGNSCGSIEGQNAWDTLDSARVLRYALDNPNLIAISSHQARLPEPNFPGITWHPLIFLRHPIDRVGSVYSFEHRQAKSNPHIGDNIERFSHILHYMKWRLSEHGGAVIKNFQTVYLSGRERDMRVAVATDADLSIALERIKDLRFFGIVEFFKDSILRMKNYLAQEFGDIETSFTVDNRSPDRKNTIEERLEELRDAIGLNLYNEVLEKNALDLQLYSNAVRLFQLNTKNENEPNNAIHINQ